MNSEELQQFLETSQSSMSEQEFFALIIDMLENQATKETREFLENYLIKYSYVDEDRVARYLEQFLFDQNPHRMMFVIPELIKLARTPDSLANKILIKFSEEGRILEITSLDEETTSRDLEHYLESHRKTLTETEFFELVLAMLENDPPEETRSVLKSYLLMYSFIDRDRVTRYLQRFLSDPDPLQRELVALDLSLMIRGPDSLAYKVLASYLGEAPTEDTRTRIMMERLIKLFPKQDVDEDQIS